MNRGYVKTWRKTLDKGWIKNHKLWAFWSWCLLKASHREHDVIVGVQTIHLMPGQFVFGRKKAAEETGLTERETRTVLASLISWGNLTSKTTNKYSIITIVNWHTYQDGESRNDQQNDQPLTRKRPATDHKQECKECKEIIPCDFSSQISELEKRYPDQEIIRQAFQAISSTRKSNRIADRVGLSILNSWDQYPVESVMVGIRTYLEKGYAEQGKDEKYLLGIIRKHKPGDNDSSPGPVRKSTGSHALDELYRSQGIRII